MNWVEEQHADVALAKPPPMPKSIREKDSTEYDYVEYLCVIGHTLGFWYFLLLYLFFALMGNEFLHLCSMANMLRNSCLVCTAHLLPFASSVTLSLMSVINA